MADEELHRLLREILGRTEGIEAKVDAHMTSTRAELHDLRRHLDVIKADTDRKLRLLAEQGADVDASLTGEINNVEARIERGFAETHAMIKLAAHVSLHRSDS